MERTMSVEDKIRRAEEIYYRRRNQDVPEKDVIKEQVNSKRNKKTVHKMIKKIVIFIMIYIAFYIKVNDNYILSEELINKIKEVMSKDINLVNVYNRVENYLEQYKTKFEDAEKKEEENDEDISEKIQNNNENIGGAEAISITDELIVENESSIENNQQENIGVKSQMEQDAQYIKENISFIKPVSGTISSMFGLRNPTTESVPKNHTGTDIAAVTGTKIISATEGTVIYTSSKGDYGNHIKIQINDVIVLYAHCNKIYVKEGDVIKQGQEIAEVGETGNATGPHLHFEIRYQERYVNPQLILEL